MIEQDISEIKATLSILERLVSALDDRIEALEDRTTGLDDNSLARFIALDKRLTDLEKQVEEHRKRWLE